MEPVLPSDLRITLPRIPVAPPRADQHPSPVTGLAKAWEPNLSLPSDWQGVWYGKAKITQLVVGKVNTLDPRTRAAKEYLLEPGREAVTTITLGSDIRSGKVRPYTQPIRFCRNEITVPELSAQPGLWVSDCVTCGPAQLMNVATAIEKAKRAGNQAEIDWCRSQAKAFVERQDYDFMINSQRKQLAQRLEQIRAAESDPTTTPIGLEVIKSYQAHHKERIAALIAEREGLKTIAAGGSVAAFDDWYKHSGASYMVHLNSIEERLGPMIESRSAKSLLNNVQRINESTYETDVIVEQDAQNVRTGVITVMYAETVMQLHRTSPTTMKVKIAKVMYNGLGGFEDKVLMEADMYRDRLLVKQ